MITDFDGLNGYRSVVCLFTKVLVLLSKIQTLINKLMVRYLLSTKVIALNYWYE